MRQIAQIMGMPVSIDIPLAHSEAPFKAAFDLLRDIDQLYSPYKKHSDTSKIQRGELKPEFYSAELCDILAACVQFEGLTSGYFSTNYNGTFDPSGYVKGWAIGQVATLLQQNGFNTYLINIGGDIVAASDGNHTWRLGLQHPKDPTAGIGTVQAKNLALATSGTYARGGGIFLTRTLKNRLTILLVLLLLVRTLLPPTYLPPQSAPWV